MKHFLYYVLVLVISATLVSIVILNQKMIPLKMITVATNYSYVYEDEKDLIIPIYLNSKDHILSLKDSYQMVYLTNELETKKVEVELVKILEDQKEEYLNETFIKYNLYFYLPYLGEDFYIDDLYIHITLLNDISYKFYLGTFTLFHLELKSDQINWVSLYGLKKANSFLSRLSEIHVEFDSLLANIIDIKVDHLTNIIYEVIDHKIIIKLEDNPYLLNYVPIIIYYDNLDIDVIFEFNYVKDYQILKESGQLIYIYALD
jgi:hypothetical protein